MSLTVLLCFEEDMDIAHGTGTKEGELLDQSRSLRQELLISQLSGTSGCPRKETKV